MTKMFLEDMMVKHALAGLCINPVGWVAPPPMLHSYTCLLLAGDKNEHVYLPKWWGEFQYTLYYDQIKDY